MTKQFQAPGLPVALKEFVKTALQQDLDHDSTVALAHDLLRAVVFLAAGNYARVSGTEGIPIYFIAAKLRQLGQSLLEDADVVAGKRPGREELKEAFIALLEESTGEPWLE